MSNKDNSFSTLLLYLSALAASLVLFPVTYFFSVGENYLLADSTKTIIHTLICFLMTNVSFFITINIDRKFIGKKVRLIAIKVSMILICAVLSFLLFNWIYALIAIIAFGIGMFYHLVKFSMSMIMVISGVNIAQIYFFYSSEVKFDVALNLIAFVVFVVLYLIYSNQNNINKVMGRRSHKLDLLPTKIRAYNLFLVVISVTFFLTFGTLFIIFKDEIINALYSVARLIIKVLADIIKFITSIGFPSGEEEQQSASNDEYFWEEIVSGGNDNNHIIITFIMIGIVCMMIFFRKSIFNIFISVFKKIKQIIVSMFKFTNIFNKFDDNEYGHIDTIIALEKDTTKGIKEKKYTFSKWKKDYKLYTQISNDSNKIEIGYKLILKWLTLNQVEIDLSNTPLEVLNNTREILNIDKWENATDEYNLYKYAQRTPNIDEINEVCSYILNMKTVKKIKSQKV